MLPTIHQCADTAAQIVEESVSTTGHTDINVSKLCQGISLDVITKCALGWQVRHTACRGKIKEVTLGPV